MVMTMAMKRQQTNDMPQYGTRNHMNRNETSRHKRDVNVDTDVWFILPAALFRRRGSTQLACLTACDMAIIISNEIIKMP